METLLDRLRKKHTKDDARKNRHAVTLLAHWDEIIAALNDGWSARKIWALMVEDNMTTMSYASFCRHLKTKIMPYMDDADGTVPAIRKSVSPSSGREKYQSESPTKKSNTPTKATTEKERLDLLKEEAFASVRSRKLAGPLIAKPKSREEENRELFGK
jgi:hypothetical protein